MRYAIFAPSEVDMERCWYVVGEVPDKEHADAVTDFNIAYVAVAISEIAEPHTEAWEAWKAGDDSEFAADMAFQSAAGKLQQQHEQRLWAARKAKGQGPRFRSA